MLDTQGAKVNWPTAVGAQRLNKPRRGTGNQNNQIKAVKGRKIETGSKTKHDTSRVKLSN